MDTFAFGCFEEDLPIVGSDINIPSKLETLA
jgi:hypothetical protein